MATALGIATRNLQGHGVPNQSDINTVLCALRDRDKRLCEINTTIYATGAPIGSDNYFAIRRLAVGGPNPKT